MVFGFPRTVASNAGGRLQPPARPPPGCSARRHRWGPRAAGPGPGPRPGPRAWARVRAWACPPLPAASAASAARPEPLGLRQPGLVSRGHSGRRIAVGPAGKGRPGPGPAVRVSRRGTGPRGRPGRGCRQLSCPVGVEVAQKGGGGRLWFLRCIGQRGAARSPASRWDRPGPSPGSPSRGRCGPVSVVLGWRRELRQMS